MKKKLAFFSIVIYNVPCVESSQQFQMHALLAQLVEHLTLNQGVQGSSP